MSEREDLTLTESMVYTIADIVGRGNFRYVAAGIVGVSPNTLASWFKRGKAYIEDYNAGKIEHLPVQALLVREVEKAESECHNVLISDILREGNPETKLRFLRLRYNKLYNNNPNAKLDDETAEMVDTSAANLLAERLATFIEPDGDEDEDEPE